MAGIKKFIRQLIDTPYCKQINEYDISRYFTKPELDEIKNQILEKPLNLINYTYYRDMPIPRLQEISNSGTPKQKHNALYYLSIRNDRTTEEWFKTTKQAEGILNQLHRLKDTVVEGDNVYFILNDNAIEEFKSLKNQVTRKISNEMFDCLKKKLPEIQDTSYDDLKMMYQDLSRRWSLAYLIQTGWVKDFGEMEADGYYFKDFNGEIYLPNSFYTIWEEAKKEWYLEIQQALFFGLFEQFKKFFGYKDNPGNKSVYHTRKFLINPLKIATMKDFDGVSYTSFDSFVEYWISVIHHKQVELCDCGFTDFQYILEDKVRYALKVYA